MPQDVEAILEIRRPETPKSEPPPRVSKWAAAALILGIGALLCSLVLPLCPPPSPGGFIIPNYSAPFLIAFFMGLFLGVLAFLSALIALLRIRFSRGKIRGYPYALATPAILGAAALIALAVLSRY